MLPGGRGALRTMNADLPDAWAALRESVPLLSNAIDEDSLQAVGIVGRRDPERQAFQRYHGNRHIPQTLAAALPASPAVSNQKQRQALPGLPQLPILVAHGVPTSGPMLTSQRTVYSQPLVNHGMIPSDQMLRERAQSPQSRGSVVGDQENRQQGGNSSRHGRSLHTGRQRSGQRDGQSRENQQHPPKSYDPASKTKGKKQAQLRHKDKNAYRAADRPETQPPNNLQRLADEKKAKDVKQVEAFERAAVEKQALESKRLDSRVFATRWESKTVNIICGNCERLGPGLADCPWPCVDGLVHGCPYCNIKTHARSNNYVNCPVIWHPRSVSDLLYWAVTRRENKPPLALWSNWASLVKRHEKDASIPFVYGFRFPWTREFPLQNRITE